MHSNWRVGGRAAPKGIEEVERKRGREEERKNNGSHLNVREIL